ncbi:MAG: signal peptidase II [Armatimonadota bacterium]
MRSKYIYLIAIVVAGIDQAAKYFADGIVQNRGAAFGMLQSMTGPITVLTGCAVVALAAFARRSVSRMMGLGLALTLGGAVGNFTDRVRLGHVVDFIDLKIWPVFNLADIAVTAGVALIAWSMFKE